MKVFHDRLDAQNLRSDFRAISHEPLRSTRESRCALRSQKDRAFGTARCAAVSRHVSVYCQVRAATDHQPVNATAKQRAGQREGHRIFISTAPQPTTSCASAGWSSASAISWEHRYRCSEPNRSSERNVRSRRRAAEASANPGWNAADHGDGVERCSDHVARNGECGRDERRMTAGNDGRRRRD